jgi:PBP1b-binding outer membrane lipoprotein LpoB
MKNCQTIIMILGIMFISGCAAVPKQLVDAVQIQQQEIERVKSLYFVNLNNQLDAIQKYQLAILDIYEEQHLAKNCKSLGEVTQDGVTILSEIPPRGDKALDHYQYSSNGGYSRLL